MILNRLFALFALCAFSVAATALPPESCGVNDPVTLEGIPDTDDDNVSNPIDNCLTEVNPAQLDTDADGYGNLCDADYDNDGFVNFLDFLQLQAAFNTPNINLDITGDGFVNFVDISKFQTLFGEPPGPTGPCNENPSLCAGPAYFSFAPDSNPADPNAQFVLEANAPEEVYHARQYVSGNSTCNGQVSANIVYVAESYNPNWTYSMTGAIGFHGSNIEPIEVCDASANHIENNQGNWCNTGGGDTRQEAACDYWCPWHYSLTQEVFPTL